MNGLNILGAIALFVGIMVIWAVLLTLPVMLLWNWLMPFIFGLTKIGFFKALGLSLLCGILFKSNTTVNKKD
jgi:hypothetical protein